ncbi:PREDICTED: uncharacterized protein LOC109230371 [Nicotiana attenuata]|uniref:uncharacterized protein LOC109230371 n=1 Tax=Nicotiana attenuata TaxID=49451 RepID=UPI00090568A1|nr:PREDICTED: uncharacterized protein LOC109230371 [Nicotiana attenuata]
MGKEVLEAIFQFFNKKKEFYKAINTHPQAMFVDWIMICVKAISYSITINGKSTKPFEARKGLRHEDPLSPYLFVLVMGYLNMQLKTLAQQLNFKFHPKCAKLKLIQLGFADDFLLFCRGDIIYVKMLFDCLQSFSIASGLIANLSKSSVFFQIFVLPKKVIKLIEANCRRILWTGGVELSKKTLLAWDKICMPRSADGLNILDLSVWNKAAICKLLWNLCQKKDKLWGISRDPMCWDEELMWVVQNASGKSPEAAVYRILLSAAVYYM